MSSLSTDELPVALNVFCLDFQHWLRFPLNGSLSFPGPPLCHLCAKCIDHHSVCSGRSPTVSPDIRRKATSGGELNKTTTFVLTIPPPLQIFWCFCQMVPIHWNSWLWVRRLRTWILRDWSSRSREMFLVQCRGNAVLPEGQLPNAMP